MSTHMFSRGQRRHPRKPLDPSSPLDVVALDIEWGYQKAVGMYFLCKRNRLWAIRVLVSKRFFASKISRLPKLCRLSKTRMFMLKRVGF